MSKMLALNNEGNLTFCTVSVENRGKGRCNHVEHQNEGESIEKFVERISVKQKELSDKISCDYVETEKNKEVSQDEINILAGKIDKIAGEKITIENYRDKISKLTPEQISEITKLSFEAAPVFSLPITDDHYNDENIKNKLYFANLPAYGISGNMSSIKQMFDKVGAVPTLDGDVEVEHSYKEGLTPGEYFARQFGARDALINKGVSTSKPGFCIYEDSLVEIKDVEDRNSTIKILWKDLDVGNAFVDGSVVVEIQPWFQKSCYELKLNNFDSIVLSKDHLLYGEIIINGVTADCLEKSDICRKNVGELDKKWICVEDICDFYNQGAMIYLSDYAKLSFIRPFKSGKPQNVRCISTSTGFYETNGLIHHNTARKLFYSMSDIQVVKDCGGPYIDAMHCNMPEGHVCEKCAHLTQGGQRVKEGDLIGGLVSTNMSEALTQLSMKQMHVGSAQVSEQQGNSSIIMGTLDGWSTSPIIQRMREAETTEEMRMILFEGLKEQYKSADIKQDDFNMQIVARKLTSYKRGPNGLEPVNPGEKCDIASIGVIGNSSNIFKVSELSSGYKHLTSPLKQKINVDASNQILK